MQLHAQTVAGSKTVLKIGTLPVVVLTAQPHCAAIPVRKIVRHSAESQGYQGEIKDQEKLHFPVSVVQKSS